MSCDFDWSTAEIIVHSYGDVTVYVNPHRDIVIRQRRDAYGDGDDDSFVVIPLPNAEQVANAIIANANESRADQAPQQIPLSLPAPSRTGAAR